MRLRPPAAGLLLPIVLAVPFLAACSSGSGPSAPSTSVVTRTATPSPSTVAPVSTGPTTAAAATSCPLATEAFVHTTLGIRLGRLTVLRSAGRAVGCRFYGQQHPDSSCDASCLKGENLPGPNQPVLEITTQRYASSTAAHNAFVLRAGTSASVTQEDFDGTTGLCFQEEFDPADKGADFSCTVNKGSVLVLVRTVDTTQTTNATAILRTVLRAVTQ